jgi:hypothetical protein
MKGFLELVIISMKQVKNSKLNITIVSYSKIMKTISAQTKSAVLIYSPFRKNIHLVTQSL